MEPPLDGAPEDAHQERHHERDQEDEEQDLGDTGGTGGNATEAQDRGDQRDDEEHGCPVKHVDLLYLRRLMDLSLGKAALMAGRNLNSGSNARTLKRLFSVELMWRSRGEARRATSEPTLINSGTVAALAARPSARCTGWCSTCSMRRTRVARCNCAESSTRSRRRRRTSSSVTGGTQSIAKRLLIAPQHRDGFLQQGLAPLRGFHEVRDAAATREDEDGRETAEDRGAVRLRGPQRQREDRQHQPEGHQVQPRHRDHEEPHRPGLLLGELDDGELQARADG